MGGPAGLGGPSDRALCPCLLQEREEQPSPRSPSDPPEAGPLAQAEQSVPQPGKDAPPGPGTRPPAAARWGEEAGAWCLGKRPAVCRLGEADLPPPPPGRSESWAGAMCVVAASSGSRGSPGRPPPPHEATGPGPGCLCLCVQPVSACVPLATLPSRGSSVPSGSFLLGPGGEKRTAEGQGAGHGDWWLQTGPGAGAGA